MKIKKSTKALAAAASLAMMATVGLSACGGSDSSETDANGKPVIRIALIKRSTQIEAKEMKLQKDLEAACDCTIKWDEILDTSGLSSPPPCSLPVTLLTSPSGAITPTTSPSTITGRI